METGQLAPSPRIREVLAAIFGWALPDWRVRPVAGEPYFRAVEAMPARQMLAAEEPWDKIDELFRGAITQ